MTANGLEEFLITDKDSDEESSDAIVGRDSDVRYCACGCGTVLSPTSKWSYKRGHKMNAVAQDVPDDPDRPDVGEVKSASYSGTRITKRMRDDIEGQVGMLLTILTMGLSAKDPVCGSALTDAAPNIAEKMVPIICKSPAMVKWLTKGTNMQDWFQLFMALLPVFQAAAMHHVLKQPKLQAVPDPQQPLYPVS